MTALLEMTTVALIAKHNALAKTLGENDLTSWKKSKAILVDKIEEMDERLENIFDIPDEEDETEAEAEAEAEEVEAEALPEATEEPEETAETETEETGAEETEVPTASRTIRAASLDLLCWVVYFENKDDKASDENRVEKIHPRSRSVGLSYADVIAALQNEFPAASTTVACLRWYAVKVRGEAQGYEGFTLVQRRPRVSPKK
jgi:hypothetical protein